MWTPEKEWLGQDAFIIGGGSSLRTFEFKVLKGKNVIGCNDAFRLGADIVKICIFGDAPWFHKVKWDLDNFKGRVVAISNDIEPYKRIPWLLQMEREPHGLSLTPGHLAWNYSTGAASVNLALTLGAANVYLLGFDMDKSPTTGDTHWHYHRGTRTPASSFERFLGGFAALYDGLKKFPNSKVFNVTDGTSKLPHFQRMSFHELKGVL